MLDRRVFLKSLATGVPVGAFYSYLFNQPMQRPPAEKDGMIFVDLHAHLNENYSDEELTDLLSRGVTGLAQRSTLTNLLTYENAVRRLPGVREIEPGLFASVTKNGKTGYIAKTQEIGCLDHHILAIGCRETLPDYEYAAQAIDEIHRLKGFAAINHPPIGMVQTTNLPYIVDEGHYPYIISLFHKVDAIEIFNGSAIKLAPDFKPLEHIFEELFGKQANWSATNGKTKNLVERIPPELRRKVIGSADAHYLMGQVQIAGFYVPLPPEGLTMQSLLSSISEGRTKIHEAYIARGSLLAGHILSRMYRRRVRQHR